MSYGPRHAIEDGYGQEVVTNVDIGDGEVCLGGRGRKPADWPLTPCDTWLSKLSPDQADQLAAQLQDAAEEARRYGR